jgi:hypothetical protein
MAVSIESYINSHAKDVNHWLLSLCSAYAKNLILKDEDTAVDFDTVCRDDRRTNKVREVLEHYGLVSGVEYVSSNVGMYRSYSSYPSRAQYEIHVNQEAFEKISFGLAEPFNFDTVAPDKSIDRIVGYPTIANLDRAGLLHVYHFPESYNVYDRQESLKDKYGSGNLDGKQKRRVVRVYPKNLESTAEKQVFRRALKDYYEENVPEFIKLMFGFEPEVLVRDRRYSYGEKEPELKNLRPNRVNDICRLSHITSEKIGEQIDEAKKLVKYAEASLNDLEKLQEGIKQYSSWDKLMEEFDAAGSKEAIQRAPLMMSSDDELAKKLATLVLKGSNKGLI